MFFIRLVFCQRVILNLKVEAFQKMKQSKYPIRFKFDVEKFITCVAFLPVKNYCLDEIKGM